MVEKTEIVKCPYQGCNRRYKVTFGKVNKRLIKCKCGNIFKVSKLSILDRTLITKESEFKETKEHLFMYIIIVLGISAFLYLIALVLLY